jgi:cystathionine beta-lyase
LNKYETLLVNAGRHPEEHHGTVNPPIYRASTILFPTLAALEESQRQPNEGLSYGRLGTPTTRAFEEAMAEVDGAWRSIAVSSGLAAITTALLALLRHGDHILVTDNVYGPTRHFCDHFLSRFGVAVTYFDPSIGSGIDSMFQPTTKAVFLEAPGSLTFEMTDVPVVSEAAHRHGALVLMDNTWATPLYFKAMAKGVDVVLHAATKYIVGHADAMLGVISATREAYTPIRQAFYAMGQCPDADACYLGLRGLRTLAVRLDRHQRNTMRVIQYLRTRPEVARILYPALPDDPGHAIWQRDYEGACGLFGIELQPFSREAIRAMLDQLSLFGLGYSWGGYESLIVPAAPAGLRTVTASLPKGPMLRLHVGLEDPEDLIADLAQGLDRLHGTPSRREMA